MFCLTPDERKYLLILAVVLLTGSIFRYCGISRVEANPAAISKRQSGQIRIKINSASAYQLETVPGIGPKLADKIIAYRTDISYFYSIEDLAKIKGISKNKAKELMEYLSFQRL